MYLELNVRPTVEIITIIRRSVHSLCERTLGDAVVSARIALATHEMLENVLRHSTGGAITIHIHADEPPGRSIRIETKNHANESDISQLLTHTNAMAELNDADAYYLQVMRACAKLDKEGGLGLARIHAEAEMTLAVKTEGDYVHIIATTEIARSVGAGAAA